MNQLLQKYNEFKSISNYTLQYELENGDVITVKLKQSDFPHLIGLHKLKDIPVIHQFNDPSYPTVSAKYLISQIKKEQKLTDTTIRTSKYFSDINLRYNNFTRDNILTVSYTDAIINFDKTKIGSSLKSDYILFEKAGYGYRNMCIALDSQSNKRYIKSFIYDQSGVYQQNQTIVNVSSMTIFDAEGKEYFEDKF